MDIMEGVGDEVIVVSLFLLLLFIVTIVLYIKDAPRLSTSAFTNWFQYRTQVTAASSQPPNVPNDASSVIDSPRQESNGNTPVEDESGTSIADQSIAQEENNQQREDNATNETAPPVASQDTQSNGDIQVDASPEIHSSTDEQNQTLPQNTIRVRLKYLNDTERTVTTNRNVTISEFKRTHFLEEVTANKTVRLICNGQLLRDNLTVADWGIMDRTVVHVHVSSPPRMQATSANMDSNLEVGNLLWPLCIALLGICWFFYIQYPEYFNLPSVVLLVVFSMSFLIVCIHSSVEV